MLRRAGQAVAIAILAVVMLGANDSAGRFNRIGHKLICACGCGQVLLECNHVSCPDSPKMIAALQSHIAAGGSDGSILNWFAGQYGATVLAAPMRGGFDNVAWIAPFVVFALATLGTAVVVTVWKKRTDRLISASASGSAQMVRETAGTRAVRERIRRETEI